MNLAATELVSIHARSGVLYITVYVASAPPKNTEQLSPDRDTIGAAPSIASILKVSGAHQAKRADAGSLCQMRYIADTCYTADTRMS